MEIIEITDKRVIECGKLMPKNKGEISFVAGGHLFYMWLGGNLKFCHTGSHKRVTKGIKTKPADLDIKPYRKIITWTSAINIDWVVVETSKDKEWNIYYDPLIYDQNLLEDVINILERLRP